MSENTRNVYQRMNAVKKGLRSIQLSKSGKNEFNKYRYMELTDFEDALEDLCYTEGINTLFKWYTDKAVLVITNVDNPSDFVEICSPMVDCGIAKASPIQNLGGTQTYLRRYLFTSTFGISEHDAVEALGPEDKKEGEWKDPQSQIQPMQGNQPSNPATARSKNSKDAYIKLINYFGFNATDKQGEQSVKALEKSKEWMTENFGTVVPPLDFTGEQVQKVYDMVAVAPENFKSDPL